MKITIKFECQEDCDQLIRLLKKSYKSITIKKQQLSKYNYQIFLDDQIKSGRPKTTVTKAQIQQVITLLNQGNSINSISHDLGISRRQIYKIIDSHEIVDQKGFDQ